MWQLMSRHSLQVSAETDNSSVVPTLVSRISPPPDINALSVGLADSVEDGIMIVFVSDYL